ncbi:hypothetical protein RB594_007059 [Gaeumannomyces avenae]
MWQGQSVFQPYNHVFFNHIFFPADLLPLKLSTAEQLPATFTEKHMLVTPYLAALLAAPRGTWALSASFNHPAGNLFVDIHGRAEGRILNGPGEPLPETSVAAPLGRRDVQAGGRCGTSGGQAVCAAGLCCSETGTCSSDSASCVAPGCQLSFSSKCDGNKSPSGKDTSSVPRPPIGDLPYGVELKHCRVNGTVALTFDDGPYIYTNEALDILGRNGVKATFFIVGANGGKGQINDPASGYAPIIKRMWDAGHQIASHTWSHQDMTTLSKQQRRDQIVKNEIAIASILGVLPTYFRPPYAKLNSDVLSDLQELGYHVTNYDVDTRDWEGSPANSRSAYLSALSSRNPVSSSFLCIAHDIQERTVHGGLVQYMIDEARRLNYNLVTIGECMGDPRGNWYRDVASGWAYDSEKTGPKGPQDNKASASQTASAGTAGTTAASAPGEASPGTTPKTSIAAGFRFRSPVCGFWWATLCLALSPGFL